MAHVLLATGVAMRGVFRGWVSVAFGLSPRASGGPAVGNAVETGPRGAWDDSVWPREVIQTTVPPAVVKTAVIAMAVQAFTRFQLQYAVEAMSVNP